MTSNTSSTMPSKEEIKSHYDEWLNSYWNYMYSILSNQSKENKPQHSLTPLSK